MGCLWIIIGREFTRKFGTGSIHSHILVAFWYPIASSSFHRDYETSLSTGYLTNWTPLSKTSKKLGNAIFNWQGTAIRPYRSQWLYQNTVPTPTPSAKASWNYRKADWSTTGICGSVQCRFNVWKISNRVDWNLQGVKSICRCRLRIWLAPFLSFRLASASPSWLFFASELFQWLDVNGLADAFNCILYTNNDDVLGIIEILPRTSIFWLNSRFIVNP